HLPALDVVASFEDRTAAEIACALLADASIRPGGPTAAGDGTWCVELRGVSRDLSARAEVILRCARARETRVVREERRPGPERAAGTLEASLGHF
ncbi:MAG TPA: hypothetical protein VFN28_08630, partial [Amaricoccus sp.]|nr:hypothetical protein [Amaricoccus sp.]